MLRSYEGGEELAPPDRLFTKWFRKSTMPHRHRLIFLPSWLMFHISIVIVFHNYCYQGSGSENFGNWVLSGKTSNDLGGPGACFPENFVFIELRIAISCILTRVFEFFQSFAISYNYMVIHWINWLPQVSCPYVVVLTPVHRSKILCTELSSACLLELCISMSLPEQNHRVAKNEFICSSVFLCLQNRNRIL